jgi:hypothetical protein
MTRLPSILYYVLWNNSAHIGRPVSRLFFRGCLPVAKLYSSALSAYSWIRTRPREVDIIDLLPENRDGELLSRLTA